MVECKLLNGDCLEMLKTLPDASVHAVVTDPPAGIAFMGKEWDEDKGGRDEWIAWLASVMRECHRALKPGGHALVWALPRTSHWTAMALEDAGFEIRDSMHHIFGSGFPKSMDVSKAIDKAAGAEREVVRKHPNPGSTKPRTGMGDGWQPSPDITAPATDAAKQWEGWGTAIKPAHEVWWLARKPLEGTVAGNVQAHGTGALNIAGCRVGWASAADAAAAAAAATGFANSRARGTATQSQSIGKESRDGTNTYHPDQLAGRWPPNLLLTHSEACVEGGDCAEDCPVAEMDRQSGTSKAKFRVEQNSGRADESQYRIKPTPGTIKDFGDAGGASRFFPVFRYEPKAAASDKESGLEYSGKAARGNTHPTPKPVALMEWLIRLITPPGGTVLDPFMGSGTTGVAATKLGHGFVGCEREREYFAISQARIGATPMPTR
jgi:DNA modification methylase